MRHSHAGTYFVTSRCVVDNLRGTPTSHIVIAAYGDGPVVVDGTVELSNAAWTKTTSGHYSTPSNGHNILQLFVDRSLQVVARYPNAKWSDKSVFYAVENWFRSQVPGKHDVETGEGGRSKYPPLATDNLLENTDGVLRPHHCSLGAAACYRLYADGRSPDDVIAF